MSRPARRGLTLAGATALLVGFAAAPAAAHVTANAVNPTQGGYTVIGFRVPTERDNASTVALKVQFPAEDPFTSVTVKPHHGWTYKVTKRKLDVPIRRGERTYREVVSVIEWTAADPAAGIGPGEFDEFQVSAGRLPEKDSITFKAIQTYSSGEKVGWIEDRAPGADEPEHPAPTLKLAAADGPAARPATLEARQADVAEPGSDRGLAGAYALGGAGLLAGLGGLVLAARRRSA